MKKDLGAWTIPKGLIADGELPLTAAKREFAEETGHMPRGEFISLGDAKQPGGKISACMGGGGGLESGEARKQSV